VNPLLSVRNLRLVFPTQQGAVTAVSGINFDIFPGEIVGLVGESGCGKSATAQAILRLHPPSVLEEGEIIFDGTCLLKQSQRSMRTIRGQHIGMIFQDPMGALNPTLRIGEQMIEGIIHHQRLSRQLAIQRALELLSLVDISRPEECLRHYPHELSGGMRQRIMIAIALTCHPKLLIADEATTALDVTLQAQILDLLQSLQKKLGMTILFITHDLGVVARFCDRVLVMYAGKIVESGPVEKIFLNPLHPYTQGLLASLPRMDQDRNHLLEPIVGAPPHPLRLSPGCAFCPRCPHAMHICALKAPPYYHLDRQEVACWLHHTTQQGNLHVSTL